MSKFGPSPDFEGAPAADSPEYIFERIAAGWFNVDPLTVRKWVAMKDVPCMAMVANMQSLFIAGYMLGKLEGGE